MIALIDADNIAFACAASGEDFDNPGIACSRADEMLEGIIRDCRADSYELWLSGGTNFRYKVYPEYKANRLDAYRPKWEVAVRSHLTSSWQANTTDGIEADDMLGIRQHKLNPNYYDHCHNYSIICHLDKDLNQIPGWHFNWELRRLGNVIREKRQYFVTLEEADYNFFYQLLVGDPTDNIKGVPGIGPKKATALLSQGDRRGWFNVCLDAYGSEEELDMNAKCVYIWRKENDNWKNLLDGQKVDLTDSLLESLEQGTSDGPSSMK